MVRAMPGCRRDSNNNTRCCAAIPPTPPAMPSLKSSVGPEVLPEQLGLVWDGPGLMAGVDEAGRGPAGGPPGGAGVMLDDANPILGLADSKILTEKKRERLFDEIRAKALCCCIAEASVEEIDALNILQATMLAMRRAVE